MELKPVMSERSAPGKITAGTIAGSREEAAHALGRFGAKAASATPALQRAQADEVPEVRDAAIEALTQIAAPTATPAANGLPWKRQA